MRLRDTDRVLASNQRKRQGSDLSPSMPFAERLQAGGGASPPVASPAPTAASAHRVATAIVAEFATGVGTLPTS